MSKMSRQDFILIATVLADASPANATERSFLSALVMDFVNKLQGTNPAFNRELFIQAATGQVSVTARKARESKTPDELIASASDVPGYNSRGAKLLRGVCERAQRSGARTLASDLAEDR